MMCAYGYGQESNVVRLKRLSLIGAFDAARGLFYVNYELQGKLGEGAFGEARLARRRKVVPSMQF